MIEIWKSVINFEEFYEISNLGRLKALEKFVNYKDGRVRHYPEKILKPRTDGRGYYFFTLYKPDYKIQLRLHRLIAIAFIPNLNNLPEVNHKDGVKKNNDISNLEWVTRSGNAKHAYDTGLLINPAAKLNKNQIEEIRNLYNTGLTQYKLADMYDVCQTQISRIVRKENWKTCISE